MPAVGYARVSTKHQLAAGNLQRQMAEIRQWYLKENLKPLAVVFKEARDGKQRSRKALQACLDTLENKHFDELVCMRMDRLTRNYRHLLSIFCHSIKYGWKLTVIESVNPYKFHELVDCPQQWVHSLGNLE